MQQKNRMCPFSEHTLLMAFYAVFLQQYAAIPPIWYRADFNTANIS